VSVYRPKRKDGSHRSEFWHFDFVVRTPAGDSRRFHGSTGQRTRSKAERVENNFRELAATGRFQHTLTMDEAAYRYHYEVAAAQVSGDDTATALAHLCRLVGGDTPLVALDADLIARAARMRSAERVRIKTRGGFNEHGLVSAATVNRQIVEMARRLMHRAKRVWKIPVDTDIDWRELRLPEARRERVLSDRERAAYVAAIREDYRPIIAAYLLTGARKAALCALRKDAVDLDPERGGFTILLKRKRGAEPRRHFMPFTPELRALFAAEMKKSPAPEVFTYEVQRGAKKGMRAPIVYNSIRRVHETARAAAGIPDFRFHDARHDTATRALRTTSNLALVKRMLGHADIASTARYAHVLDDDLRLGMASFSLSRNGPEATRATAADGTSNPQEDVG
jgi:integrase